MRDFRGLDRIVDSFFEKRSEFEKRADPPHSGLNDPNPFKRLVYRKYGYIPQSPGSYLYTPEQKKDYRRMYDDIYDFEEKQPWYDENNPTPEQMAAWFDLRRAAGDGSSYYMTRYGSDGKPFISLGSYPASETALRHELGHYSDDTSYQNPKDFVDADTLGKEIRAWDIAGVPAGNPIREASLDTYRLHENPGDFVERDKTLNETLSGIINRNDRESAKVYQRPELYMDKYKTNGIPIIHGYNSALQAAKDGYKF